MNFYPLTVAKTTERIGGLAKTVEFNVPAELTDIFAWQAGQHITLSFDIDGKAVRRSYTISASPHTQDGLQITTKRVKDGLVSNYINDNLNAGDTVLVAPPNGNFVLEPTPNQQRTHYFFGAGSGITPLRTMINTVLLQEPHSTCHLLYANRDDTSIIFKEEFEALQAQFPKRLTVSHILSKPRWTSAFNYWQSGRIDQEIIAEFISEHPPYAQDTQYYMCAPNALLSSIQSGLHSIDVPSDRIHFETFGGKLVTAVAKKDYGNGICVDASAKGVTGTVTVMLNGETYSVQIKENQTLLEAMLASNINAPYSCQSGVCGTCICKLADGLIAMRSHMALDDAEITAGFLLSCQSVASSNA